MLRYCSRAAGLAPTDFGSADGASRPEVGSSIVEVGINMMEVPA